MTLLGCFFFPIWLALIVKFRRGLTFSGTVATGLFRIIAHSLMLLKRGLSMFQMTFFICSMTQVSFNWHRAEL